MSTLSAIITVWLLQRVYSSCVKTLQIIVHIPIRYVCNYPFVVDMYICYVMIKLLISMTKLINLSILKIIFQNKLSLEYSFQDCVWLGFLLRKYKSLK